MDWSATRTGHVAVMLASCALALGGCANCRLPRIDPSGERILLPAPSYTTPVLPGLTTPRLPGFPRPAYETPPTPAPCLEPGAPGVGTPVPAVPRVPRPDVYQPQPRTIEPAAQPVALGMSAKITLTPTRLIAPVGSEVVLRAGVCGADGFYVTGQRIEWMLSQQSVGHFVEVGSESRSCWRRLTGRPPQKTASDYAVGRTSRAGTVLTRGTATPQDDIPVLSGETWLSVASADEGVSRVTAHAPDVQDWDRRRQAAVIHWIDAQWLFPPPAIVRVGQTHVLSTSVVRHTSGAPVAGWVVRYQIVAGPPAAFSPHGTQVVEVPADAQGTASVEIAGPSDQPGITQIRIQVVRPGSSAGDRPRLVVGQGATSVTWSAPGLAVLSTGPDIASVDATVTYRIEVSNPGDLPSRDVVVSRVGFSAVRPGCS